MKALFLDYDNTISAPALIIRDGQTGFAISDNVELCLSMSQPEIMANFGGASRVQTLRAFFDYMQAAGVELFIISSGNSKAFLAHLGAVGLREFFPESHVYDNVENKAEIIDQKMCDTSWTFGDVMFVDDMDKHVLTCGLVCQVHKVLDRPAGMCDDDFTYIKRASATPSLKALSQWQTSSTVIQNEDISLTQDQKAFVRTMLHHASAHGTAEQALVSHVKECFPEQFPAERYDMVRLQKLLNEASALISAQAAHTDFANATWVQQQVSQFQAFVDRCVNVCVKCVKALRVHGSVDTNLRAMAEISRLLELVVLPEVVHDSNSGTTMNLPEEYALTSIRCFQELHTAFEEARANYSITDSKHILQADHRFQLGLRAVEVASHAQLYNIREQVTTALQLAWTSQLFPNTLTDPFARAKDLLLNDCAWAAKFGRDLVEAKVYVDRVRNQLNSLGFPPLEHLCDISVGGQVKVVSFSRLSNALQQRLHIEQSKVDALEQQLGQQPTPADALAALHDASAQTQALQETESRARVFEQAAKRAEDANAELQQRLARFEANARNVLSAHVVDQLLESSPAAATSELHLHDTSAHQVD